MSYGPCAACPAAVAAWGLTAAAVAAFPEAELLCQEHLRKLYDGRELAARLAARELERRYCAGRNGQPCGRELYLMPVVRAELGDLCAWCKLGQPVSVAVPCGDTLNPRTMGENYTRSDCEWPVYAYNDETCESKKVYRLPDGRVVCDKHGAGQAEERITS